MSDTFWRKISLRLSKIKICKLSFHEKFKNQLKFQKWVLKGKKIFRTLCEIVRHHGNITKDKK